MNDSRWYLRIMLAVAVLVGAAARGAQPAQAKEPAKENQGAKKDLAVADLKGEWVDSQKYKGATVIITITFGADGTASYLRVALLGDGKIESDISGRRTTIEKRDGKDVIKVLDGTYRCQLSEKGNLDLTLVDGKGPASWSFARTKDKK
jgi:hypothetical protein